jgi:hypothetical protein
LLVVGALIAVAALYISIDPFGGSGDHSVATGFDVRNLFSKGKLLNPRDSSREFDIQMGDPTCGTKPARVGRIEVDEGSRTVAVRPFLIVPPQPSEPACDAVLHMILATVRLHQPLGRRAVVDASRSEKQTVWPALSGFRCVVRHGAPLAEVPPRRRRIREGLLRLRNRDALTQPEFVEFSLLRNNVGSACGLPAR